MEQPVKPAFDPVHDYLHYERQPLDAIFAPKNVAVIGATETEGSVGRTILWNLISSPFGGTVFPINPKRPSVLGIKAYPNIGALSEPVDLAVVVTPAITVPDIIRECVDVGVKGAIVISAGFKETGAAGVELERQLLAHARHGNMRIIGPNCLGVMSPTSGLNATFATTIARRGKVGFISQSGALCTAVLDWSLRENVGFSAFVSIGSMLDVDWGDLIYYLGDDPHTESIVIYMESIGDAQSFISAAREVALTKPIIVIKPGRTAGAAKAAASHTGSLTGSDEVLEAAFHRSGVLRVNTIAELFYMAEVLAKQPRPKGPRLTILTNAGGPGVLATDALITGGGELAEISPGTMEAFNALLPAAWSHNNPVDILGDASPSRYARALEIAAQDQNTDGLLVILTPQAMTDPTRTADELKLYAQSFDKPIIASWMGGSDVAAGEAILNHANIPTFPYPDTAARMFDYMVRYADNLHNLYETPMLPTNGEGGRIDRAKAAQIIQTVRESGRTILTEYESKQLLAAYGIPVGETRIAKSEDEAVEAAGEMGYPVVLKLHSETITHKTDVGGVKLNLADAEAVRQAFNAIKTSVTDKASAKDFLGVTVQPMIKAEGYELILGSSIDPQFGPVLLFGMGGQLVEVFKDRALALPPLTTTLAKQMMSQTKIYTALKGVRGRQSVDMAALEQLIVRFSQLVVEQRWIKELDINPLLASPERLLALDARVVVYDKEATQDKLPRLAIRPYPNHYATRWTAKDGTSVMIRPIRPEDEPMLVKFHETLSDRSVYLRYLQPMLLSDRVAHERLLRICHSDYDRDITLIAEREDKTGERSFMGASRMTKLHGMDEARFSVLISDCCQGLGLGSEMVRRVVQIARDEKLSRITAFVTPDNQPVQHIFQKLGFNLERTSDGQLVEAKLVL
ncbi:MAG: acyl-CoA synthetase forming [Chloroflexi bacterium]|nr:acyl-CoA synthetase forming [Chloroflexota bacterium]